MARLSVLALAALCVLSLAACGGGSGNGGGSPPAPNIPAAEVEPNGSSATATPLSATNSGSGNVGALDFDWWSFTATAGSTIRVELHAIRADQTTWDLNGNDPQLELYDTDGVTPLLIHDRVLEGWPHGQADLDFPAFHVPADGTYFINVMSSFPLMAGGNYVVIVKTVSTPGSFQTEAEPPNVTGVNDGSVTAQAITPGTVFGWHNDNFSDFYSFNITGPTIVSFEVLAYRNGLSRGDANLSDLQLTLYTPGLLVIQANDNNCFLNDPGISYFIQTAGTYYVQVSESPATAGDGEYFLFYSRVGAPLAPTETESNISPALANSTNYNAVTFGNIAPAFELDHFKFFGEAGDVVGVQAYDVNNAEGATATIAIQILDPSTAILPASTNTVLHVTRAILQTSGTHYVKVIGGLGTPYHFRLLRFFGSDRETEPNDTVATANAFPSNTISGVIAPAGNVDHFSFGVDAGEVIVVHCFGGLGLHTPWAESEFDHFGSPLFPRLCIFDPGAVLVAISNRQPAGGNDSTQSMTDGLASVSVTYVAPAAGTYTVQVSDQLAGGAPTFVYVLERR